MWGERAIGIWTERVPRRRHPFEVRRTRGEKVVAVGCITPVLGLFGLFAVLEQGLGRIINIGVAAMIAVFVVLLVRMPSGPRSRPVVSVTDEGIEHEHVDLLRWEEIGDVRIYKFPVWGERAIGIWPYDYGLVSHRGRGRFRRLMFLADVGFQAVFRSAPLNILDRRPNAGSRVVVATVLSERGSTLGRTWTSSF